MARFSGFVEELMEREKIVCVIASLHYWLIAKWRQWMQCDLKKRGGDAQ
jgi:hypothetical protein